MRKFNKRCTLCIDPAWPCTCIISPFSQKNIFDWKDQKPSTRRRSVETNLRRHGRLFRFPRRRLPIYLIHCMGNMGSKLTISDIKGKYSFCNLSKWYFRLYIAFVCMVCKSFSIRHCRFVKLINGSVLLNALNMVNLVYMKYKLIMYRGQR